MGRKWREEYKGGIYHVIARGNNIEKEEVDYEKEKIIGNEVYQLMCLSKRKKEERKRLDEILIETGVSNIMN